MGARVFLLAMTAGFAGICLVYFLAVDTLAIPERHLPRSYKQFLLEAAAEQRQRIFIDGGSNTIYGIDAGAMEASLGRLTLVLGDNAHYPLSHKLYRLQGELEAGDLVILPLEWFHYTRGESMPGIYVESILDTLGSNGFYYHSLPLWQRMLFVFRHVPFHLALERVFYRNAQAPRNYDLREDFKLSSLRFGMGLHAQLRGDYGGIERSAEEYAKQKEQDCDRYVFGLDTTPGLALHPDFLDNLALMGALQARTGARFFLAWPSVTDYWGDHCYRSQATAELDTLVAEIREAAAKYGIEVLGTPRDSAYDKGCFWDTYYHLTRECAGRHTAKLVAQLLDKGVEPIEDYDSEAVNGALLDYLMQVRFPDPERSHRLDEPMIGNYMPDFLNFLRGWSTVNFLGAWAAADVVAIAIPVGDLPVAGLQLDGHYLSPPVPVEVIVNGHSLGAMLLERQVIDLGEVDTSGGVLVLELRNAGYTTDPNVLQQEYYRLYSVTLLGADSLPQGVEVEPVSGGGQ